MGFLRRWKYWPAFLGALGPGIVAGVAGNDAGGVATYATVGAAYGYQMLWVLLLCTPGLIIVQEMSARLGVVTGKGLSDLIRENYGVRWTIWAMGALVLANGSITVAEFAGIAAGMEVFGASRYLSVPAATLLVWWLVVRGSYRRVELASLFMGGVLALSYFLSLGVVEPEWGASLQGALVPSLRLDTEYMLILVALVGTTISPYMPFYLGSAVVEKRLTVKEYALTRLDVVLGVVAMDLVALFITIVTAATLHRHGITIGTASDAALALRPLAGPLASYLFALGFVAASFYTACILPLTTAFVVCEAFGWEKGVDRRWSEAPIFFGLYTALVMGAALLVLLPGLPLMRVIVLLQGVNSIALPLGLVLIVRLANDRRLLGRYVNGPIYNAVAWVTTGAIVVLNALLLLSPLLARR